MFRINSVDLRFLKEIYWVVAALETFLSSFFSICFCKSPQHDEVACLLVALLLLFQSWQGLPRTAQWGHLSPTAICAQVLLIRPSESTFLIPLPQPWLPELHGPRC